MKFGVPIAVLVIAGGLILLKEKNRSSRVGSSVAATESVVSRGTERTGPLPRLIDLGADKCIPCKKMAPILEEIGKEYRGVLEVEFIDVWKNRGAGEKYGIRLIPTQIFYDSSGKELTRHEGFMGKEEILGTFRRFGSELEKSGEDLKTMSGALAALSRAVEGTPLLALGASLVWGVFSIILSPCHLAGIPLIVGFIDEQGRISLRRAFVLSLLFAVGILSSIGIVGAVTAGAGRMIGDVGRHGNYLVAVIFLVIGLHLLDFIPMPWSGPGRVEMKRKGLAAAFIIGLAFGIALGPCTFAYMAPMLAVTFKLAASNLLYGLSLLLAYGIGHCSVIVAAGTFAEGVQHYLNWNERSRGALIVKKACGVLIVLGGLYMIYSAR